MPNIVEWLRQYIEFYPLAAFIGLMLAGLNVPISEDLIIITGAFVAQGEPSLLIPTFAAIYAGVVISDFVSYWLGTCLRQGTRQGMRPLAIKLRFITEFFDTKNFTKAYHYLEKFGIITFIVCRFIPFGVRNTLFLSSGFFGLRLRRFVLYDISAATISVSILFFLVYYFGEAVEKPFHIVGIALFVIVLSTILFIIIGIIRHIVYHKKTGV
ncbi:MAG: VTT domain-containing protein [Treponema sp.]|jgi:membrane protein DedA with SNARE-associated domain|nr:VTT domain-containing protein [Treponema sp.]